MPSLYIIAGPNGAGKKTFIKRFARARNRIAELTAAIARYQQSPFSVNETP